MERLGIAVGNDQCFVQPVMSDAFVNDQRQNLPGIHVLADVQRGSLMRVAKRASSKQKSAFFLAEHPDFESNGPAKLLGDVEYRAGIAILQLELELMEPSFLISRAHRTRVQDHFNCTAILFD